MKKIISVIFAAGLFLLGPLTVTSQSWSLPQDNSPKEVIDWATPDVGMKPFEGIYKGKAKNYPYDDIYEDRNETYMCYSTDGSYKENITFEQSPSVQFIYDIDSALYYQFVRARNDSGNSLILWGIFSTSGRYAN